jgi:glycogen debranching enzyme
MVWRWGRDTFVALTWITMVTGDYKLQRQFLIQWYRNLKALISKHGYRRKSNYNSADTPLWFFWALQQYGMYTGDNSQTLERIF